MEYKASVTGIVEFCKSPKHYKYYVDRKKETTDLMRFGTAFHLAMLEPDLFPKRVKTLDALAGEVLILKNKEDFVKFLTQKGVEFDKKLLKDPLVQLALSVRNEGEFYLESEAKDKFIVLSDDKINALTTMQENAQATPFYKVNRDYGQKELRLNGVIEGVEIRGCLDQTFKKQKTHFVVDYKTCKSVAYRDFSFKVIREKMFVQMYLYNELLRQNFEGVDRIKDVWFGVESSEPHICQAFTLSEASIYDSALYVKQKIHEFKSVLENQNFFGYTNENYEVIEVPNYAFENVFDLEPNGKES